MCSLRQWPFITVYTVIGLSSASTHHGCDRSVCPLFDVHSESISFENDLVESTNASLRSTLKVPQPSEALAKTHESSDFRRSTASPSSTLPKSSKASISEHLTTPTKTASSAQSSGQTDNALRRQHLRLTRGSLGFSRSGFADAPRGAGCYRYGIDSY